MCIICIDLDKNKLTPWEAATNRKEMLSQFDEEHLKVLDEKITKSLHDYLNKLGESNEKNKCNQWR
tara:strand:- start:104 stop:301 length:198 start_codon:yes stop_codon:yes gene_type:complete